MIWSFLAVLFSGWIYIDASYRGPTWQQRLFKPVTFLLLIAWAWQAPINALSDYLVLFGLIAAMLGGMMTLFQREALTYAFGILFLSALLYTFSMTQHLVLDIYWAVPIALLVIAVVLIAILWQSLEDLRWPAIIMLMMNLVMGWVATQAWLSLPTDRSLSLMIGAGCLILSNIIWFISDFKRRFPADRAIYEALFIVGNFMMARELWLM